MSLLSPDRLDVFIGLNSVQAAYVRGFNAQITDLAEVPVQDQEKGDWGAHLEAVSALLDQFEPSSMNVVLSDHLVRYLTLPWNPDLKSSAEEIALARFAFEESYSEADSSEWALQIEAARPGSDRLVCAIALELLEGLKQMGKVASRQKPVRVDSVQPNLIAVMRRHKKELPQQGWFVNQEGNRATISQWDNNGCLRVASSRCEESSPGALLNAVRQEMLLAGFDLQAKDIAPVQVATLAFRPGLAEGAGLNAFVLGLSASTLQKVRSSPSENVRAALDKEFCGTLLMGARL